MDRKDILSIDLLLLVYNQERSKCYELEDKTMVFDQCLY
jgi:hypothetical protein